MSTQLAFETRPQRPGAEPVRHLEIAPSRAQRRARPKVFYAVVTIGGIVAILMTQLMLSIVIADGAYQISSLEGEQRGLERERESLTEDLERYSSTQNLTANAERLGMVASGNPIFLDVETGAVSGEPTPAGGSLTGAGNLIGNSLVDETMVIDPEAQRAAAEAETLEGGTALPNGEDAPPGAEAGGAGAPAAPPAAPPVSSDPDALPSPTTR